MRHTSQVHGRGLGDTSQVHVWYMCGTCVVHAWYMRGTCVVHARYKPAPRHEIPRVRRGKGKEYPPRRARIGGTTGLAEDHAPGPLPVFVSPRCSAGADD